MPLLLASIFLSIFSFFNLLGIRKELVGDQIIFLAVGLIIYIFAKKVGLSFFKDNARFFYWIFIFILVFTYIVGVEVKGSRRWISFYFVNFQPSEFFKIFFIAFLANYLVRHKESISEFSTFLKSLFFFAIPTFIIFRQPDLGNAAVFIFIYFTMILFSKIPKKYALYLLIFFILTIPLSWVLLKDYQRVRIVSFLSPKVSVTGANYNMFQSIISVGSGNFLGRGLGKGTQSELFFLPENHTDFAFSSLVEQFGFLGGLAVLFSYLTIVFQLFKRLTLYYQSTDDDGKFKFFLVLGFLAFLIFQVFVNVGMNLGLVPITGIALPLISYGGSSIVSFFLSLALLP